MGIGRGWGCICGFREESALKKAAMNLAVIIAGFAPVSGVIADDESFAKQSIVHGYKSSGTGLLLGEVVPNEVYALSAA